LSHETDFTPFTPGEDAELIRLLLKVAATGYRWPTERSMRVAHGVISHWASEIVITRPKGIRTREILLAIYEGGVEEFRGMWHIPGGCNIWNELDIQTTCSRVALSEIGVDVKFVRVLDAHKWREGEHPYGRPLSLYCLCEPQTPGGKVVINLLPVEMVGTAQEPEPVEESEKLRFFSVSDLPERLLEPHRRFIEQHLHHF